MICFTCILHKLDCFLGVLWKIFLTMSGIIRFRLYLNTYFQIPLCFANSWLASTWNSQIKIPRNSLRTWPWIVEVSIDFWHLLFLFRTKLSKLVCLNVIPLCICHKSKSASLKVNCVNNFRKESHIEQSWKKEELFSNVIMKTATYMNYSISHI